MPNQKNVKTVAFFAILAIAQCWIIGAYGSPIGFAHEGTDIFRNGSRIIIGLVGIAAIFLLPGKTRFPRVPLILWVCFGFLILWCSFMVFNAQSDMDIYRHQFLMVEDRPFPALPGSPVVSVAKQFLGEIIAVFLFVIGLARSAESNAWKGILGSFSIAALLVTLIGLTHKFLAIDTVWGLPGESQPETVFAPYVYNANAAALLNLGGMIAFAFALQAYRKHGSGNLFKAWLACGALIFAGVLAAASKAGALILVGQMGLFVLFEGKFLLKMFKARKKKRRAMTLERKMAIGAAAVVLVGFAIISIGALSSRFDEFFKNIEETGQASTVEGRVEMMKLMVDLSTDPENGYWHGIGPGSFPYLIPFYRQDPESKITGVWDYGHCDPLQTILEWGYFGALAWFTIGIGAVLRGLYLLIRKRVPSDEVHLIRGIVVALIGTGIHSCFDFPLSILSIHLVAVSLCAFLWVLYRHPRDHKLEKS